MSPSSSSSRTISSPYAPSPSWRRYRRIICINSRSIVAQQIAQPVVCKSGHIVGKWLSIRLLTYDDNNGNAWNVPRRDRQEATAQKYENSIASYDYE